jgi:hypothetical protein
MLTLQHCHKEVNFYKSLTGKEPARVYVYHKQGDKYTLKLIPSTDFYKYQFIGYYQIEGQTYSGTLYPVVISIEN